MPIFKCPECGSSENDGDGKCIKCGVPIIDVSSVAPPIVSAPTATRAHWIVIVMVCLMMAVVMWYVESCNSNKTPNRTDLELFKEYYSKIIGKTALADKVYKPFGLSLDSGDSLSSMSIARRIERDYRKCWVDIDREFSPKLENAEASELLKDGHEKLSGAYYCKLNVIEGFVKLSKSPSISIVGDVKESAERVTPLMVSGLAKLFAAGEKLGMAPEDIANIGKEAPSK
jgi:hypothetical protein